MRFLVVDDDTGVREMVCRMLESEGHEVINAVDGADGIRKIKSHPDINVVITDLIMPEKEGIETIREIKKDFADVKILAISGGGKSDPDNYLRLAKAMGAHSTLSKPFVKKDLIDAVEKLFES